MQIKTYPYSPNPNPNYIPPASIPKHNANRKEDKDKPEGAVPFEVNYCLRCPYRKLSNIKWNKLCAKLIQQ